jgi:hypothetical protein
LNVPTHPHQKEDEGGFATPREKLKNEMGEGMGRADKYAAFWLPNKITGKILSPLKQT